MLGFWTSCTPTTPSGLKLKSASVNKQSLKAIPWFKKPARSSGKAKGCQTQWQMGKSGLLRLQKRLRRTRTDKRERGGGGLAAVALQQMAVRPASTLPQSQWQHSQPLFPVPPPSDRLRAPTTQQLIPKIILPWHDWDPGTDSGLGTRLAMAKSHDDEDVGFGAGVLLPGWREDNDAAESHSGAIDHIYKWLRGLDCLVLWSYSRENLFAKSKDERQAEFWLGGGEEEKSHKCYCPLNFKTHSLLESVTQFCRDYLFLQGWETFQLCSWALQWARIKKKQFLWH